MSTTAFGRFVAAVPPPMAIGTVRLDDGSTVKGFLCEPAALSGSPDISAFGGWRAYRAAK
jgi:allophanate hydrolase